MSAQLGAAGGVNCSGWMKMLAEGLGRQDIFHATYANCV